MLDIINAFLVSQNTKNTTMKKLIALLLPLSFLTFACTSPSTKTEVVDPEQTEAQAELPTETETEVVEETAEETATVVLVTPEEEIKKGETELILEVKDTMTGEPVEVEMLEVMASMPMEGEEPMMTEVVVEPAEEPGQFKAKTNLEMEGEWELVAMVKDAKYKGENKLNLKVN